jgi:peroxiredoxin
LVDVLTPLHSFLSGGIRAPKSASFAPDQPQHALLRVLLLEFPDHTEKLWIAAGKKLLAAVVVQKIPGGGELRYDMIFDRCVALPDAKPEDYKTLVPAGYKQATSPESSLLVVGAEAPNVQFTDVDGNKFDLESLRGKTVLLNFWFLLCPPCRAELPQLSAMWSEMEAELGDDVVVLCVNKDDQAGPILDYWIENEFLMTPVMQKKGAVDSAFGVRSWPTNYVIGPDGRVRYVSGGWDAGAVRRMLMGGK